MNYKATLTSLALTAALSTGTAARLSSPEGRQFLDDLAWDTLQKQNHSPVYVLRGTEDQFAVNWGVLNDQLILYAEDTPCQRRHNWNKKACPDTPLDTYLERFPTEKRQRAEQEIQKTLEEVKRKYPETFRNNTYRSLAVDVSRDNASDAAYTISEVARKEFEKYKELLTSH